MRIFSVPNGTVITLSLGAYECQNCGKYMKNVDITGILTATFFSEPTGGLRRRVMEIIKSPCGCGGITGINNGDTDQSKNSTIPFMPSELQWWTN